MFTHPEGNLFFRKVVKGQDKGNSYRFLTEDILLDPKHSEREKDKFREKFDRLIKAVEFLKEEFEKRETPDGYNVDIYIGEREGGGFDYYFANHGTRSIFWIGEIDLKKHCDVPIQSERHLGMPFEPDSITNVC